MNKVLQFLIIDFWPLLKETKSRIKLIFRVFFTTNLKLVMFSNGLPFMRLLPVYRVCEMKNNRLERNVLFERTFGLYSTPISLFGEGGGGGLMLGRTKQPSKECQNDRRCFKLPSLVILSQSSDMALPGAFSPDG